MMALSGSLQLSCHLGIYKNHKYKNQFKRLDTLSFHLLDSVKRPILSVPSRHNVVICRSFVQPVRASEIPVLKSAASTLTRSYNAFHGSPVLLQLVPALGIIVFAVWGLAPLMRHSRNLFLRRSDSSWRSSSTHHVTTSYLQPLLMWIGATLLCRALDPIALTSEASQAVKQRLLTFIRSLSTVLAIAYCLSSLVQQAQKFFTETTDSKDTRNMGYQFAGKAIYSAVWVAAVSLFMELLGFSTQKWLTAGGLGTVLLTLAGREIFTNFLSSVMIHATRPFVLNEWIQTKIEGYDVSGTVEHVGWWSPTIIRGEDREAVHIPNHKFTVNIVRNLSQKTHWRIKTHLAVSHLDVKKINNIVADMRKVLAKNPQVEQQRLHRRVFLENINPENQALLILISCFVKTSHFEEYLCVKEAILLDLLRVISHHRARLATPIRTVQKIHSDADMENIPFSETIFTRASATASRPFLLIEPPYKINGDDKTKAHARSTRTNEELGNKSAATVAPDSKVDKAAAVQSDLKADNQVADMTLDSEADHKVIGKPIAESKEDTDVETTSAEFKNQGVSESKGINGAPPPSLPNSNLNPEVAAKLPNLKDQGPSPSNSVKKNLDKQPKKVNSGDARRNSKADGAPVKTTASAPLSKSSFGGLDSVGRNSEDSSLLDAALKKQAVSSEAGSDKPKGVPSSSHAKQESERVPVSPPSVGRSSLEENIVLGVALEGSKRTLPIEDDNPSPTSTEKKGLAACGNGNGSSSPGKDKKEEQILASPGDQRDQGR